MTDCCDVEEDLENEDRFNDKQNTLADFFAIMHL